MTITEKINYVEKIDYVIKRIKEGDKPTLHVDNNETFFQFQDGTEIVLYGNETIHALAGVLDIEVPL